MHYRLGLGAQWIGRGTPGGGPTAIAATASRRLTASLRIETSGRQLTHSGSLQNAKSKRKNVDESQSDSDNEEESRAFAARPIVKRRRATIAKRSSATKKVNSEPKANKGRDLKLSDDASDNDDDVHGSISDSFADGTDDSAPDESESLAGKGAVDRTDARNKLSFTSSQNTPGKSDSTLIETAQSLWSRKSWQPGLVSGVRKRKKIRSRQKNLRKDKRPRDRLPSHLNEETLARGRVKRQQEVEYGKKDI